MCLGPVLPRTLPVVFAFDFSLSLSLSLSFLAVVFCFVFLPSAERWQSSSLQTFLCQNHTKIFCAKILLLFFFFFPPVSRSWNYTKGVANQKSGTARILKIHERTVICINQIIIPHSHPPTPKNVIIFVSRSCGARPEPNNWSRRRFNVTPFRRSRPLHTPFTTMHNPLLTETTLLIPFSL